MSRNRGPEFNRHHVNYPRTSFMRLGGAATMLRSSHVLIPTLEFQTHRELHANAPTPYYLPPQWVFVEALDAIQGEDSTIRAMERLARLYASIGDASRDDMVASAAYCMENSMTLQLPYIKDGIITK